MGSKGVNLLVMVAIVSLYLSVIHLHVAVEGVRISLSKEEDWELEAQLKILNKPPVKTIHTELGDIYDCIDIYKQPALDHPLLKNHEIQMKPSLIPKEVREETTSTNKHKALSYRTPVNGCPKGTVPIRRTRKEDLIGAKTLSSRTIHDGSKASSPSNDYAVGMRYTDKGRTFYGARAKIDVYNPSVAQDQHSSAEILVGSGPDEVNSNGIRLGWMVNPQLYGDNSTRSFAYWTADGGQTTGCFNTLCPGFVQVHPTLTPSSHLPQMSVFGGNQYTIQDTVEQDNRGDWWLIYESNIRVGYWPKALLPLMTGGAEYIRWQGRVKAGADGTSPPMGSGQRPDDHFNHACFFSNLKYASESREYLDPNTGHMEERRDCSMCYGLKYYQNLKEMEGSDSFLFGGPGGKCT